MLDRIQSMIEEYNIIVLFRHEYPDMDAIGAQLGLKQIIKEKYPEKNVYALGAMSTIAGKFIDRMDEIEDDKLSSALAVILDTSNSSRVDDQRYKVAAASIRIDHHIPVEQFCDVEYIDEKSTATCELIALGLHSLQCTVSKKAAQLLYEGLVADSIRFTISTVRKETMVAAAYLIDQGADVVQCEEDNFYSTFEDFQYETKVRQKAVRYENCLVSVMELNDYRPMSFSDAKEKVYVLSGIESITCWALFTRMEDGQTYSASLRSKRLNVRDIATAYGGGGHRCASGIKNLTRAEVDGIIKKLAKRSKG